MSLEGQEKDSYISLCNLCTKHGL